MHKNFNIRTHRKNLQKMHLRAGSCSARAGSSDAARLPDVRRTQAPPCLQQKSDKIGARKFIDRNSSQRGPRHVCVIRLRELLCEIYRLYTCNDRLTINRE